MPSASVGYSSLSDASVINDGSEKLVPLVERLVRLVEDKGADILVDEEQEESEGEICCTTTFGLQIHT